MYYLTLGFFFFDTSEGKVEGIMNNVTRQVGGNTVTSDLILEPDFLNGGNAPLL